MTPLKELGVEHKGREGDEELHLVDLLFQPFERQAAVKASFSSE